MNAIGVVECKNISKGIVVTDEMLKSAGIVLLSSGSVCPGKYVTVVGGELSAIRASVERAEIVAEDVEERIDEKTRIIVYKDEDENNSKRKSYKQMIDLGENNYTQEKYEKYCNWWGVYFLQTTTDGTAAEVYSDYKARWSIETYNNYIKNDANFNTIE